MYLANKRIMIGLSAGINSAAILCWTASLPSEQRPDEVHLYYAHFKEHSEESLSFVLSLVEYAKKQFKKVIYFQSENSLIAFFEKSKMIPHPANSPCSRLLKILPMMEYRMAHKLDLELIGFVREEKQRATKMRKRHFVESALKQFPILNKSNEWCFKIVKQELGWYPKIYDIRWNDPGLINWMNKNLPRIPDSSIIKRVKKKIGTDARVFKHNNCLPCKNMQLEDLLILEYFYPTYLKEALLLSMRLKKYWGRNAQAFYKTFEESSSLTEI